MSVDDADLRPTLAAPDDDPWIWLEDINGDDAVAWADRHSQATRERFGGAGYEEDRRILKAILDRPDNIPYVTRRDGRLYNYWKDAENPRGLWRRTDPASYLAGEPDWQTIIDLDAQAEREAEDWIWGGLETLPGDHQRALVRLSRGGSDAVVLREFDLPTGAFVSPADGGFYVAEAKGGASWIDRDTVLLSSAISDGMATTSGYARTVRLWRRGEAIEDARCVFETDADNMVCWGHVDWTGSDGVRIWYCDKPDFFSTRVWSGGIDGPQVRMDWPERAETSGFDDWLLIRPGQEWTPKRTTYSADSLLGISLSSFLKGDRDFEVLFDADARSSLSYFFSTNDQFVVVSLDDLRTRVERWRPDVNGWQGEALPDVGGDAVTRVWRLDAAEHESDGTLCVIQSDPLHPTHFAWAPSDGAPSVLRRAPEAFDATGLVISRHDAVAEDGERIPYTQVGPGDEACGNAPVYLGGYGGFEIPLLPEYRAGLGKLWLERGGTTVFANIRGGGEFGSRWHDAGRGANKRVSHDDFAAVAADLVRRGVTVPGRIAAEGGSNGGILITNMLTRYPERFGALFCTIPLIDMRRYAKLLAGASWIAEYGDPDKPEDWEHLQHISAYHNVEAGAAYPPILIATTRRDDRVHPGHARKMAAKLQSLGYDAHYYELDAGGHGYGKDNDAQAGFSALGLRFLSQSIGWTD